jgi:hypothetical protein
MTAKVTERVNALNGETGQVLHPRNFPQWRSAAKKPSARKNPTKLSEIVAPR